MHLILKWQYITRTLKYDYWIPKIIFILYFHKVHEMKTSNKLLHHLGMPCFVLGSHVLPVDFMTVEPCDGWEHGLIISQNTPRLCQLEIRKLLL